MLIKWVNYRKFIPYKIINKLIETFFDVCSRWLNNRSKISKIIETFYFYPKPDLKTGKKSVDVGPKLQAHLP